MFKDFFPPDNGEGELQKPILGQTNPRPDAAKRKSSDRSAASDEDKKPRAAKKAKIDSSRRKPKNFAERLMRLLQDGVGQDTIWWVGEGKAIGIHSRNLRRGDLLKEHFNVKDYSVFIRNCNRWGFRRTVQYKVPQGVITYQCSLFQRDKPHLVHHMRMDSDVQDVFEKHKDLEGDAPFDPKRIAKAAKAATAASVKLPRSAAGQIHADRKETAAMLQPQPDPAVHPALGSLQGYIPDNSVMQTSGMPLWRTDPPAAPAAAPSTQPHTTSMNATEAALLERFIGGSGHQLPEHFRQAMANNPDPMLQRILYLSQEYTETEDKSAQTTNDPMNMAIRMLKLQGEKFEKAREIQRQLAVRDPLSALRNQLLAATNNASNGGNSSDGPVNQTDHVLQSTNMPRLVSQQGVLMNRGFEPRNQHVLLSERSVVAPADIMQLLNSHRDADPASQYRRDSDSQAGDTTSILDLLQSRQNNRR